MTKVIPLRQILALNAGWIGISFMWSALHPIVLPALLLNFVPTAHKNTYLGLLTFMGLVIAMLVQPTSGRVSDGWVSHFGRRRPLIMIGTALSCLFLAGLGFGDSLLWIFVGYVGLQAASNIAQGPLQGLLRDRVPVPQLGLASSVKVAIDILCLSLAAGVAGHLMNTSTGRPAAVVGLLLILLAGCTAITVFLTPEAPTRNTVTAQTADSTTRLHISFRQNTSYWWLIAERASFLLGVYGLQVFGQYYLQDVLQVPDPPRQAGNLLAAIGAGTLALVLIGGWMSDRFGAKRLLFAASGLTILGLVLMLLATDARSITLFGPILGGGIGLFLASNWAMANRLAPPIQAGEYLGLTNLATAGSAAVARLQGPAVDFLNAAFPQQWLGYRGIFAFGILCVAASVVFLARVEPNG